MSKKQQEQQQVNATNITQQIQSYFQQQEKIELEKMKLEKSQKGFKDWKNQNFIPGLLEEYNPRKNIIDALKNNAEYNKDLIKVEQESFNNNLGKLASGNNINLDEVGLNIRPLSQLKLIQDLDKHLATQNKAAELSEEYKKLYEDQLQEVSNKLEKYDKKQKELKDFEQETKSLQSDFSDEKFNKWEKKHDQTIEELDKYLEGEKKKNKIDEINKIVEQEITSQFDTWNSVYKQALNQKITPETQKLQNELRENFNKDKENLQTLVTEAKEDPQKNFPQFVEGVKGMKLTFLSTDRESKTVKSVLRKETLDQLDQYVEEIKPLLQTENVNLNSLKEEFQRKHQELVKQEEQIEKSKKDNDVVFQELQKQEIPNDQMENIAKKLYSSLIIQNDDEKNTKLQEINKINENLAGYVYCEKYFKNEDGTYKSREDIENFQAPFGLHEAKEGAKTIALPHVRKQEEEKAIKEFISTNIKDQLLNIRDGKDVFPQGKVEEYTKDILTNEETRKEIFGTNHNNEEIKELGQIQKDKILPYVVNKFLEDNFKGKKSIDDNTRKNIADDLQTIIQQHSELKDTDSDEKKKINNVCKDLVDEYAKEGKVDVKRGFVEQIKKFFVELFKIRKVHDKAVKIGERALEKLKSHKSSAGNHSSHHHSSQQQQQQQQQQQH